MNDVFDPLESGVETNYPVLSYSVVAMSQIRSNWEALKF